MQEVKQRDKHSGNPEASEEEDAWPVEPGNRTGKVGMNGGLTRRGKNKA